MAIKEDKLLSALFDYDRWTTMIDKSNQKGINKQTLIKMCDPDVRLNFYQAIITGNYEIAPPHIARIPKDTPGEFREVYVNEAVDRIFLALANDCLCELYPDMIHPQCKSYQKGIGTQKVIRKISHEIVHLKTNLKPNDTFIGYKADLSKYFDSVDRVHIHNVFNAIEDSLGFARGAEPILNVLRKYYDNDTVFDIDGNLIQHYGSLKQGCAVAAFLANVMLYDIDDKLSRMDIVYYRYSDDILMVGKDAEMALGCLEAMLTNYGLKLNPKKVQSLFYDKWFTFLGFKLKGNQITLSRNRVKNFQKEITKRSISNSKTTYNNAKHSIMNYLYGGDYNWATSCLGTINVKPDIDELNRFIIDCLRACGRRDNEKGKKKYKISIAKIGGLGSIDTMSDRTITRGPGITVTRNVEIEPVIEEYITLGCLSNDLKISPKIFTVVVNQYI